jgi:hypothetical protein
MGIAQTRLIVILLAMTTISTQNYAQTQTLVNQITNIVMGLLTIVLQKTVATQPITVQMTAQHGHGAQLHQQKFAMELIMIAMALRTRLIVKLNAALIMIAQILVSLIAHLIIIVWSV